MRATVSLVCGLNIEGVERLAGHLKAFKNDSQRAKSHFVSWKVVPSARDLVTATAKSKLHKNGP